MARLLIIAHTPLASSLRTVAGHAYPDAARTLEVIDVPAGMPPEEIERQARAVMSGPGAAETLIFTDVFGATPCNAAQRVADGVRAKVVTGVNVPMLWRVLCYAEESLDSLVVRALAGATQGVMQVASSRPQNQAQTATSADDQDSDHHQQ